MAARLNCPPVPGVQRASAGSDSSEGTDICARARGGSKYPSAAPTTRYSSSTTVQYRTDEGSLTGNARIPVPPTISKRADPTGNTVTSVHATPKETVAHHQAVRPLATMHDSRRTQRERACKWLRSNGTGQQASSCDLVTQLARCPLPSNVPLCQSTMLDLGLLPLQFARCVTRGTGCDNWCMRRAAGSRRDPTRGSRQLPGCAPRSPFRAEGSMTISTAVPACDSCRMREDRIRDQCCLGPQFLLPRAPPAGAARAVRTGT